MIRCCENNRRSDGGRNRQQVIGGKGILLVAGVGQDGGETTRTFLDEEGFFPILIQHLQPLGPDPTGGLAGHGGDRMGRASRGNSTGPEAAVGAVDEGGDLLEVFGSDLVAHRQSPRVESREHPATNWPGPLALLPERAG
jgi:hypothetical protein